MESPRPSIDWGAVLAAGQEPVTSPEPEPTIIPAGKDRIDVLTLRVMARQSTYHPLDAKSLPPKIDLVIHRGNQGQIEEDGLSIAGHPDDPEPDDPIMLPGARIAWLAQRGYNVGPLSLGTSQTIIPCQSCGWEHETYRLEYVGRRVQSAVREDRCSWCGGRKSLPWERD